MSLSTSTKTCQYFPLVYLHVYSLKTIECNFWSVGSAVRLLIFWCWLHHLRALRALISYWVLLSLCFPICQLRIIIFSISNVGWKRKQNNIAKIFTPRKVPKLWKVWVLVSSLTCTRNDSAFYRNKEPWSCLKSKPSALGSNICENIFWSMTGPGDSLQRSDHPEVVVLQDRVNPLRDLGEAIPD